MAAKRSPSEIGSALARLRWAKVSRRDRQREARARGIQRALAAGQNVKPESLAFLEEFLAARASAQ